MRPGAVVVVAAALVSLAAAAAPAKAPSWRLGAPLPVPRSEVAATAVRGEIVVVGGFLGGGGYSARVDAYDPARNRWRRLPDLPVELHHAMAATGQGRLYVVGGYGDAGILRTAYVLDGARWTRLPDLPGSRAAAGAAVVGNRLYVAGGVTDEVRLGDRRLAQDMLVLDLATRRWTRADGPTPREHLGVTASRGRVYAVAGRLAGLDTNLALVEAFDPAARSWRRVASVPGRRGGTGAAAWRGTIISAGGEEPGRTIRTVYALNTRINRWRRLPNLRVARHGLGVAALGGRVYVIAGGRTPGLSVSGVNESIALGG